MSLCRKFYTSTQTQPPSDRHDHRLVLPHLITNTNEITQFVTYFRVLCCPFSIMFLTSILWHHYVKASFRCFIFYCAVVLRCVDVHHSFTQERTLNADMAEGRPARMVGIPSPGPGGELIRLWQHNSWLSSPVFSVVCTQDF